MKGAQSQSQKRHGRKTSESQISLSLNEDADFGGDRDLGEKMSNAEMDQLLDGLEDINGLVNYAQFIKKLMSDEAVAE